MKKTLFLAAALAVSTASATDYYAPGGADAYTLTGNTTDRDHLILGANNGNDYADTDFTITTTSDATVWSINDKQYTSAPVNAVTFNFEASAKLQATTSRTSRFKTGTFTMNFAESSAVTLGGLTLEGKTNNGATTATIAMADSSTMTLNQALTAEQTSMTLNGTSTSNVVLKNGGTLKKLDFNSGVLTLSGGTLNMTGALDMSRNQNASTGAIKITGGKLKTNSDLWMSSNSGGILLSDDGELFRGTENNAISVKALSGMSATVTKNKNGDGTAAGGNYTSNNGGFTITNAVVTMTNARLENKLVNSDLVSENDSLVVVLQDGYSLNNVTANHSMKLFKAGASSVMKSLTLNNGSDVLSYVAMTEQGTPQTTLTTTMLTVNDNGSVLNGGLVVSGTDAMITFADNTTLTLGGAVTIGDSVTVVLTDEMVSTIEQGGHVTLFDGVTSLNLGQGITFISGSATPLAQPDAYIISYDEATHSVYVSPEPATATLSLLALAGLVSRRRRH